MTIESREELDESLAAIEEGLPHLNTLKNPLWKTTNQCQVLLNESGAASKPVKITSTARRFTPNGLFFLDSIYFYGDFPRKLPSTLTVTIKPIGKAAFTAKLNSTSKFANIQTRTFCEWFEIASDNALFGKPTLTKINIYGCDIDQLKEYSDNIITALETKDHIENFKETTKSQINKLKIEEKNLSSKTEEKNDLISTLENQIKILEEEANELKSQNKIEVDRLTKLKIETKITSEQNTATNNNVSQLNQTEKNLNEKISNLNNELKKLTSDKSLISDEYGPYVKEGKSQAALYVAIVTLPLLIILFSVYELYAGATKILASEQNSFSEVAGAFILRVPFAAVFGLAIYYSWRLTSSIVQKIFTIHGDRLALAKLLVLAREATHSSAKNLDISNEYIYQEQLKLKVEVLKSHLSKDLGKDFNYPPTLRPPTKTDLPVVRDSTNDDEIPDTTSTPHH